MNYVEIDRDSANPNIACLGAKVIIYTARKVRGGIWEP